ncbi:MAG: SET domain-containing protein-lysine N-methyltransferase [Paludibacteraceae bacterium]|nr:SET domain-containing protein-lysine N-methyltransferase [Paludibacteraceae bacterium]
MKVEIKQTKDKGRGVFACALIRKDSRHLSHGIVLAKEELNKVPILWTYAFAVYHSKKDALLVLDWTSLLNDAMSPNLAFFARRNNQVEFVALRDIQPGEELTIHYGYDVYRHAKAKGINIIEWNKKTTL